MLDGLGFSGLAEWLPAKHHLTLTGPAYAPYHSLPGRGGQAETGRIATKSLLASNPHLL